MKYFYLGCALVLATYALTTHAFEVPDENAHYASLHFLSQEGRVPTKADTDNLSLEESKVESIFGIVGGENKYSYHPEYRIEQVEGKVGKYEGLIASYNTTANRTTYLGHRSAIYPPLYYGLTLPLYNLVADQDILTRLFVSRFSSVIFALLTIVVSYHLGYQIFRDRRYALTLSLMTLFYPMTGYLGGGVNSDNLHNLLFGFATLLLLKYIQSGYNRGLMLTLGTTIALDILTKPQAYILFPIFGLAIIVRWQWRQWRQILSSIFYVLVPVLLLAGWQEIPKFFSGDSYVPSSVVYGGLTHFTTFISGYVRTHLSEMPVWYWGVFKWFGVILPRPLWWIGTRLIGLSVIGLIIRFYQDFRSHKLSGESRFVIFGLGANLIYVSALCWFDWQFYQQFGRSLGLQARYYMPLLTTQLALILMGLTNLGWTKQVKELIRWGIVIFFLSLQLTAFYVQLASYYDLTSLTVFFDQLSQYKPYFAKGQVWYLYFALYFLGIITTTILTLRKDRKSI